MAKTIYRGASFEWT